MNMNEVLNAIMGLPGAAMARVGKTNFVVVPTEDGYVKVNVSKCLDKETKTHAAFNYDAAVAEYRAYEAEKAVKEAERAATPKRVPGPNPEAQARRDELDAKITALPHFENVTATDIFGMLAGQVDEKTTVMTVGLACKRLVENGVLTVEVDEKNKKFYTKA